MTDPDSEHLFWVVPRKKYGKARARCNEKSIHQEYLPTPEHHLFKISQKKSSLQKNPCAKGFRSYSTKDSDEMYLEEIDGQKASKIEYRPSYLDDESFKHFIEDKDPDPSSLKPDWNPSVELSSQISQLPLQELERWQKEHTEFFSSEFHEENCERLLSKVSTEVRKKIEVDIIRDCCKEALVIMSTKCQSLKTQFKDVTYKTCCGYLPEEDPEEITPPLEQKVFVQVISHSEKSQLYPAILIVPTDYATNLDDLELLERSLEVISKHWFVFQEFFGFVTNFKRTTFVKYDCKEKKFYKWQHVINFNECLLLKKSPEKLEDFFKIWYGMILKAEQNYSQYINLK